MRNPISILIAVAFLISSVVGPMPLARGDDFHLPVPGVMVYLSPAYEPPMLKGIKVHMDNPFRFDFILDKGEGPLSQDALKDESSKLIRYFLASLTIPEKELWVNLSPYEKQRIIPQSFGLTEMGRDLLAEDYMLKQITASLIYPEDGIGKRFWQRVYEEASKRFGTTNIPVNTFNKVWIVPENAVVYENSKAGAAYVVDSKLKVMLEEDYLALNKGVPSDKGHAGEGVNALGSQIIREIVIPELTREVNEDKNFARLRQVYNSLILATWYKSKIKDSILTKVYEDRKKVAGIGPEVSLRGQGPGQANRTDVQFIYQRYLQAFKKGVYNYIKEETDPLTLEAIPRKYFSGGMSLLVNEKLEYARSSQVPGSLDNAQIVTVDLSAFPSDKAMAVPEDPLGGYLNGLEGDLVSDNFKLSKAVDPRDQRVLIDLKGLVRFINFIIPYYRIISLDSKVLNDFIERMDRTDNPLVDNRRNDYLYNLLLLTVSSMKKKVWVRWLEQARQGREYEAIRNLEKNDTFAVSPVNLELSAEIPLGDGYFLRANQSALSVTFKIIKQEIKNGRRINRNAGIIDLGWDDNTSSWVAIPPHGIKIYDAYRGQGLAQKAFSKLIDQLGVVRAGITPDEVSPFAQRMFERMGASIEYTGYYPSELKMYRSDSGWSYVMRRDSAQLSGADTGNTPASGIDRRDFLRMATFLGASFAFPGIARSVVIQTAPIKASIASARKKVLGQLESIGKSGKVPANVVTREYWLDQVFNSDQNMYLFALDDIETALEAGGFDKGSVNAQRSSKLAIQALTEQTMDAKLNKFFSGIWSRYMISLANNDKFVSVQKDILLQRAQDIDPTLGEMIGRLVYNTTDWQNKNIETQWQAFNDAFLISKGYYAQVNQVVRKGHNFYFALIYHIASNAKAVLPDGKGIDVLTGRRVDRVNFGGSLGHTFNGLKRIFIDLDAIDDEIRDYMSMSTREMVPYTVIDLKKLSGIKAWLDRFKVKGFEQIEAITVNSTQKHELGHKIYESFGITQPIFDGWRGFASDDIDRIQSEVYAFLSQIKGSQSPGIEIFSLFRFLMTEQSTIEYYVASFILDQMSGQELDPKHPVAVVQAVDGLLHLSDTELAGKAAVIMDKYYPTLNEKAMVNDQKNGGIDLTAAHLGLQTQNEGGVIEFHLDPALFDRLQNALGFAPVIVNIKPMGDLHEFLGISPAAR